VSSFQFDEGERGFSFSADGPLDMRMDATQGRTAADLANTLSEDALADILRGYGEEKRAKALARAIIAARPITRTRELAEIAERVLGRGAQKIHPATRAFQALRIAVNDELGELEAGLEASERVLNPHGRLAVVAFHSLEDRIVKQFLAERSGRIGQGSRHLPSQPRKHAPTFTPVGKNPQPPNADELRANPRARSARLRGAERSEIPAWNSSPRIVGEHA
jgi:16S rRNA (cytosine1402-N4)-methyltransferase